MSEIAAATPPSAPRVVERWETEIPLLILVAITSLVLWIVLFASLVGAFYAIFIGLFLFFAHLGFIAHLRGSAVKLGPDQLPDLYARVQTISQQLGLKKAPDAYLMQAGGTLNALATKFFGSSFIVLFSDLLEACEDDQQAADFIIAHEIGHLKAGHLRFRWFLILGQLFPFLGGAYSRAREYTADRYGFAAVSNRSSAIHGLTVLAAGGAHAKKVNLPAFVQQRREMTSVLMTLGRWLSTHPPIVDRIAEGDRMLAGEKVDGTRGILGALAVVVFLLVTPFVGGGVLMMKFMKSVQKMAATQTTPAATLPQFTATTANESDDSSDDAEVSIADPALAATVARADMEKLAAAATAYREKNGKIPGDTATLYLALRAFDPAAGELRDPFDGERYGYRINKDGTFEIWSGGPDDLVVKGR